MGHRCNYVLIEDGAAEVFYSHWGALTVPQDIFWGPAFAERFIRGNELMDGGGEDSASVWLDNVWAEGGALLDKDRKRAWLFGGEDLGYGPLRPVFLELMAALWADAGWCVSWAERGQIDLLEAAGIDPAAVGCRLDFEEGYARGDNERDEDEAPVLGRKEALEEIFAVLLTGERFDARALLGRIMSEHEGGSMNPHAMVNPSSGMPDPDTARALLSLALTCLGEGAEPTDSEGG